MIPAVDRETLRRWLDEQQPVVVVDVRPAADRADWSIPGSLHVDAHASLNRGESGPLDDLPLPAGVPVVTVCGAGHTSLLAAERLRARGIDAYSLDGGMAAWSLSWNIADVPLAGKAATAIQIRRTGKGCLSYLIGSQGEALAVDPSVEPAVYVDLAREHSWTITQVLDTHVHADHLSRAGALAAMTGARRLLPATGRVRFAATPLHDGDSLAMGAVRLTVIATPGHTPESYCLLLDGAAVLTGDTLFLNSVGRPDLDATADEAAGRAHDLWHSLQQLLTLPPATLVLPAHTSEPVAFDGRPLVAALGTVRETATLLQQPEAAFVASVLARLPAPPPNHQRIVGFNEAGTFPAESAAALEAGGNRCAIG